MATMTNTLNTRVRPGNNRIEGMLASGLKFEFGKVTFSGTYTTGGDDWLPETMKDKDRILYSNFSPCTTGYAANWDHASSTHLSVWDGATQHAAAGCTLVFDYMIVGY